MSTGKRSFSTFTHIYLGLCYFLIVTAPLLLMLVASRHAVLSNGSWLKAAIGSSLLFLLLLLSNKYASTEQLGYYDGLLYITAYCNTGWSYSTFFVAFPVLVVVFIYVAFFSTLELVSKKSGTSAEHFYKLIVFAHKHRSVQ